MVKKVVDAERIAWVSRALNNEYPLSLETRLALDSFVRRLEEAAYPVEVCNAND